MVRKNMKGGQSPSPLTPGEYKGVGTIAVAGDANYAAKPNTFPSNQVGGMCSKHNKKQRGGMSYGFANTTDVPNFAGSYSPVTPMCTAKVDVSRGGNNFMSGGKKKTQRGGLILLGGMRSKSKRSKSKRSKSNKRSKSKRSRTQRGGLILLGGRKKTQKWRQKGCSKKK